MAKRERKLYAEKYRRPGLKIRSESLPTLSHVTAGFRVSEAYVEEAGRVERSDGTEREYQVIRVYFTE